MKWKSLSYICTLICLILIACGCVYNWLFVNVTPQITTNNVNIEEREAKWKILISRGIAELHSKNFVQANKYFKSSLEVSSEFTEEFRRMRSLDLVAKTSSKLGNLKDSIGVYSRLLTLQRRIRGDGAPQTIKTMRAMATCYAQLNDNLLSDRFREEADLLSKLNSSDSEENLKAAQRKLLSFYRKSGTEGLSMSMKEAIRCAEKDKLQ